MNSIARNNNELAIGMYAIYWDVRTEGNVYHFQAKAFTAVIWPTFLMLFINLYPSSLL